MYNELKNICHLILKCDMFKMLTAGMMANYGFMLNMHDNVLYKTKNGHKRGEIKTNKIIQDASDIFDCSGESIDDNRDYILLYQLSNESIKEDIIS